MNKKLLFSLEKEALERVKQTTQNGVSYASMAANGISPSTSSNNICASTSSDQLNALAAGNDIKTYHEPTDYEHWGNELTKWVSEKEGKCIRGVNLDSSVQSFVRGAKGVG